MYTQITELINSGRNIFITGSAGTGKSYILNQLREEYDMDVTASTGMAAVNVSGSTIHSFSGVGIGDHPADEVSWRMRPETRERIRSCKILSIDEISMLSAEILDLINETFKLVRGNKNPFGEIQLIVIGDFLQLPPVSKDEELPANFAFESNAWAEAKFETVLLEKVYRQTDKEFLAALGNIRIGKAVDIPSYQVDDKAIRLFALNRLSDAYNFDKLRALKTPQKYFEAIDSGEGKAISLIYKNCLAPKDLYLKVGSRVMLLINKEIDLGLINGSTGEVIEIHDVGNERMSQNVTVKFDNGVTMSFGPEIVARIIVDKEEVARRIQVPLRLAWAISIHKSQGMTLDKVHIDAQGIFECGQAYVALSRVRSKEGLSVVNLRPELIMANPKAVEFYEKLKHEALEV